MIPVGKVLSFGLASACLLSCCGSLPARAQASSQPPAKTEFYPLKDIHRGQHGVAYTVFEGVLPETMDVEILGLLHNSIGPGQDMILARLGGKKAEYTGVVAGMSGSPVYIDGKLVGAISYRIGQFSKEPIAGITPIEQMLQVRDADVLPVPPAPAPAGGSAAKPVSVDAEIQPMETALVFNGFTADTITTFGDRFTALGLHPVIGAGSNSPDTFQPEPIVPGSAVSAVMADGDLSMAGTCTVTYVDPKQLLACGHPITQYGNISMPMTKAEVLATLSSPLNSFKIINTTQVVGAFTQDRASAISGHFGQKAEMIPITVDVKAPGAADHSFHFRVLNNPELTPNVLLVSIYQAIHGTNNFASETSYRLSGDLKITGHSDLHMDTVATQGDLTTAPIAAVLYFFQRFSQVYSNPTTRPDITDLHIQVEQLPGRRVSQIESARLSTIEARAGDTITIQASVRPYQSSIQAVQIPIKLPSILPTGPVRILVSDAATLDRLLTPPRIPNSNPLEIEQTIQQLNREHANNRVYVTLLDKQAQAVTQSEALPEIPISIANIYQGLRDSRQLTLTGESAQEAGSAALNDAVTGSQVLTLNIR